jgi:hypothetical protein
MNLPDDLVRRLLRHLEAWGMESSYHGQRTGGVLAGCPRGPAPAPGRMAAIHRIMARELRDAMNTADGGDEHG